jgi:hypothetical protein
LSVGCSSCNLITLPNACLSCVPTYFLNNANLC